MKCKCSSTNKYEIVGLCDIEEFSKKIQSFTDKSWTQVSISDTLVFLKNKLSIKTITKTFIDVKITSTKIINTPEAQQFSIEGLNLTGKLLLVSGKITQRILYISNNSQCEKINSAKIDSNFTTYIVIDKDVDVSSDKYCVYPCVEYASLRPINECTLSQNVTLFLFAHRIESPVPPVPPTLYPNDIIFKNDNGENIAVVRFTISNKSLFVRSTGSISSGALQFRLYESNGTTLKGNGVILARRNGEEFVNSLNRISFEYDDIIRVGFGTSPNRVEITNYPADGQNYNPTTTPTESFRIGIYRLVKI